VKLRSSLDLAFGFALRRESLFFACPKKRNQKKRHPRHSVGYADALRCSTARGASTTRGLRPLRHVAALFPLRSALLGAAQGDLTATKTAKEMRFAPQRETTSQVRYNKKFMSHVHLKVRARDGAICDRDV